MIHIPKKIVIAVLLLCAALPVFSEQYYSLGTGLNFWADHFPNDSYSRQQVSTNVIFSFYYFSTDSLLGLYARASIGGSSPYREQNEREFMLPRNGNLFEFRAVASPSFRLKAGSKCQFPFSLGPTLIYSNEKISERTYEKIGSEYSGGVTRNYFYESISWGLNGDAAFMFIPAKHFFIRQGISLDYIFLRAENGEMRMNYRTTHNTAYKIAPYYAVNFSFYFGLGLRF